MLAKTRKNCIAVALNESSNKFTKRWGRVRYLFTCEQNYRLDVLIYRLRVLVDGLDVELLPPRHGEVGEALLAELVAHADLDRMDPREGVQLGHRQRGHAVHADGGLELGHVEPADAPRPPRRGAVLAALLPDELEEREKELLVLAKEMMPRLPFNDIDLLIIDEMGKDISGTGIDPNITGRNRDILGVFPHPVNAKRLFVGDLTPSSGGNAIGIGFADVTTKRLVDKIDRLSTYMNCITGISLEKAAIPMHFETDRECIRVALGSVGLIPPERSRVVRIKNTLQLDEVEVSEIYKDEITNRPDLEILAGPRPMSFDDWGNLVPLVVHGADRKGDN